MKFQVHHITISVRNIDRTEKFYDLFGFKRFHYWQADDKSLEIVHLKNAPPHTSSTNTDLPVIGNKHFAFKVDSLPQAKEEIERHGIELITPLSKGRTKIDYFFIKDPDGILVEIVQDNR